MGEVWMCGMVLKKPSAISTSHCNTCCDSTSDLTNSSFITSSSLNVGVATSIYNKPVVPERSKSLDGNSGDTTLLPLNSKASASSSDSLPVIRRVAPFKTNTAGLTFSQIVAGNNFVIGIVGRPISYQPPAQLLDLFHRNPIRHVESELSTWEFDKHHVKYMVHIPNTLTALSLLTIYLHQLPSLFEQREVFPSTVHFGSEEGANIVYTRTPHGFSSNFLTHSNSITASSHHHLKESIHQHHYHQPQLSHQHYHPSSSSLLTTSSHHSQDAYYYTIEVDIFLYPELKGIIERVTQKKTDAVTFTIQTEFNTYVWTFTSKNEKLGEDWWKPVVDSIVYSFEFIS